YKLTVVVPDTLQMTQPNNESEGDDVDSDFSRDMFMTDTIMLMAGDRDLDWDAGMFAGANIVIADPCVCLNNATNSSNGQFGEEVIVVEGLPGDAWQIIEQTGVFLESSPEPPMAPIPVPIGTALPPTMDDPSKFELVFRHVEEIGYNVVVSNGFDTLSIGRTCFYPEVTLAGLPSDSVTFCVNADPITPMVESNIPGDAVIFLNDVPVTEIDPATLGLGDYEIRIELDPFDSEECKAVTVTQVLVVDENCPSKVGDFVWLDENRNGRQDGFEQGFDSVKVILTPVNVVDGRVDNDTAYTDANGKYHFDVLEGFYKLTFCEPEGYRITLPNNDTVPDELDSDVNRVTFMTDTFFIPGGAEDLTWDAGLVIAPGSSDRIGCNCLDNATGQDDGQFLETVNVSGVAGDTWRIITSQNAFTADSPEPPAAPIPLPLGSTFTEIDFGIYEINFRHVDGLPYFVEMTNGFDTLNFSKLCTYPDVIAPQALADTLNVCVELSNFIPEIMVDQPGTFSYTIEGQPVDDINPSSLGVGVFELGRILYT
ncbi:MAG: SdrD B-like domain-containing protein, partial [Bacteroidota bacterium]